MSVSRSIGTGAVGYGGEPSRTRKLPDLCPHYGHPGVTYNPGMDRTWCLCGARTYTGDQRTHMACCGGPLEQENQ